MLPIVTVMAVGLPNMLPDKIRTLFIHDAELKNQETSPIRIIVIEEWENCRKAKKSAQAEEKQPWIVAAVNAIHICAFLNNEKIWRW